MTAFAAERGIIGHNHHREPRYFPFVAMLDTAELFEHIPAEGPWKLPLPFRHTDIMFKGSFRESWDIILREWIHYLDQAKEGFRISHIAATEHIISGDHQAFKAARYFNDYGLEATSYEEQITKVASARRAFGALLSKDAQKKLELKGKDIHASPEDIQNARTLVSNFERTV